jgi:hypothetical protein
MQVMKITLLLETAANRTTYILCYPSFDQRSFYNVRDVCLIDYKLKMVLTDAGEQHGPKQLPITSPVSGTITIPFLCNFKTRMRFP